MNPDPAHVDSMSWVAGVLDVAGNFKFRQHKGYPYTTRLWVICAPEIGTRLSEILGIGTWRNGKWTVSASSQERLLAKVIPYLRSAYPAASRIYRWRLTAPIRRPGWRVSPAVDKFRAALAVDAAEE